MNARQGITDNIFESYLATVCCFLVIDTYGETDYLEAIPDAYKNPCHSDGCANGFMLLRVLSSGQSIFTGMLVKRVNRAMSAGSFHQDAAIDHQAGPVGWQ